MVSAFPTQPNARLIAMATAAASALVGDQLRWEEIPEAAKQVFLRVALAVQEADRLSDADGTPGDGLTAVEQWEGPAAHA